MPTKAPASDTPFYGIFVPQKISRFEIFDDVIACDLQFGPPLIKNYIYRPFIEASIKPFIEAPNPYDDKQGWLKNQNKHLEPIWQVGPILPSALVDIVASRGGVEDTTFEAKAKNRLIKTGPFEA